MWQWIDRHSTYNCAGAIFREKPSQCLGRKRKRRVRDFRAFNGSRMKSKYRLHGSAVVGMIVVAKEVNSKTRFTHTTSYCTGFFGEKVCVKRVFLWTIINMKTKKLVHGIGVNDSDYVTKKSETIGYSDGKQKRKLVWACPHFRAWKNMIERCYSTKYQERYPTYRGCSVSAEWLTFSVFKNWMMAQNWEDKHLDKDLLFQGNKVYGPNACVFVTPMVNLFTNDHGSKRGEWLIGAGWHKASGKFQAQCSNPFTKKRENLGYFTCEQEAHQAWLKRKLELAHLLAAIQTDPRVAKALINRYSKPQDRSK